MSSCAVKKNTETVAQYRKRCGPRPLGQIMMSKENMMKLCKHEDCAKQSTHIYEKKDACYTKVKSRYDVWPSAYASGALVKCRKVGAKNWGNKSKKEGVKEGYSLRDKGFTKLPFYKKLNANQRKAVDIALIMGGDMTGAVKEIEKIKKGLSKDKKVKNALKMANESVNEKVNPEMKKIYTLLIKYGNSAKDAMDMIKKNLKYVNKTYRNSSPRDKAVALVGLSGIGESVKKESYDIWAEDGSFGYSMDGLLEAEYQGRKVKLGKPMQGDAKKFKVYVKNDKGNVVKVNFGQGGDAKGGTMRIRKSNPGARKSFRARHNCDTPGPRHKARYWSCKKW